MSVASTATVNPQQRYIIAAMDIKYRLTTWVPCAIAGIILGAELRELNELLPEAQVAK
jgi:hypothetical protein